MCKGVFANDGFVKLDGEARYCGYAARDIHQFGCVNFCVIGHDITPHFHCHHDFFQGGVSRPFPKAVDRTFNLTRPACDSRERICGRHAKVIVTMGGKDHLIGARDFFD